MTAHEPRLDALSLTETAAVPAPSAQTPAAQIPSSPARSDEDIREDRIAATILAVALGGVALWAGAVLVFGWPGLILPAVAAVPAILVWLVLLTRG